MQTRSACSWTCYSWRTWLNILQHWDKSVVVHLCSPRSCEVGAQWSGVQGSPKLHIESVAGSSYATYSPNPNSLTLAATSTGTVWDVPMCQDLESLCSRTPLGPRWLKSGESNLSTRKHCVFFLCSGQWMWCDYLLPMTALRPCNGL